MLLELHVKNLALIDSAHVEFGEGLNILTGETGAGKSVIIGSVNMALGQKAPKEMIRQGADYALVELVFQTDRKEVLEALLPKVLLLKVYTVLMDSYAAEQAARTVAMQLASDNADELLDQLTLEYNKRRQQAITSELLDIVGGSLT